MSKSVRRLGDAPLATVLDRVEEDSGLTPGEKETSIGFAKPDDRARIFTAEAGLARRLLAHPASRVQTLNVLDEGGDRASTSPEDYDGQAIVGVTVTLPIGALLVKRHPRSTDQHAAIGSKQVFDSVEGRGGDDE